MSLYDEGQNEFLKGAVHGATLGLGVLMTGYNMTAHRKRPTGRLLFNKLFYSALVVVELYQLWHHSER